MSEEIIKHLQLDFIKLNERISKLESYYNDILFRLKNTDEIIVNNQAIGRMASYSDCEKCYGSGWDNTCKECSHHDYEDQCEECDGKGRIWK